MLPLDLTPAPGFWLWTLCRYANLVLSVVCIVMLLLRDHEWKLLLQPQRFLRAGLVALLVGNVYATYDSLNKDIPSAPRVGLITIGILWITVGCFIPRSAAMKLHLPWKKHGSTQLRD